MRVILASASPRRKELLHRIFAEFAIIPAKGEEQITKKEPGEAVMELARQKAAEVAKRVEQQEKQEKLLVIGADTVVAHNGKILGKPKDGAEAMSMLRELSGDTHCVYTGVSLMIWDGGAWREERFFEETKVTFYPMSEEEIQAYVASGEPMDKAGAYAVQGGCAIHIKCIAGDYNNVVGLPVAALYQRLKGEI